MCILNYCTTSSDAFLPDAKTFYRPFIEKKYSTLGNPFSLVVSFHVSAQIPYTQCALSGAMDSRRLGRVHIIDANRQPEKCIFGSGCTIAGDRLLPYGYSYASGGVHGASARGVSVSFPYALLGRRGVWCWTCRAQASFLDWRMSKRLAIEVKGLEDTCTFVQILYSCVP